MPRPPWVTGWCVSSEYTITMYDTKTRELRWNATYFDYAASLPEDDVDYSEYPRGVAGGAVLVIQGKGSIRRKSWISF